MVGTIIDKKVTSAGLLFQLEYSLFQLFDGKLHIELQIAQVSPFRLISQGRTIAVGRYLIYGQDL